MSKINTRFSSYIKPGLLSELPVDLKREILESAAYAYPAFALRMATISREVQPWAERIIYRELFFNGQRLFHRADGADKPTSLQRFKVALESRPPAFFAEYVRSLHFDGSVPIDELLPILRVCTGVDNFGLYASLDGDVSTDEVYRLIHSLPLHTLFISSKNLEPLLAVDLDPNAKPKPPASSTEDDGDDVPDPVVEDAADDDDAVPEPPATEPAPEPEPVVPATVWPSSLRTLVRLGLVDGFVYPHSRFPALTHLGIVPDFEDKVIPYVKDTLANPRIESVVAMLSYINTPRQINTIRALRDITDNRLVLFTLPVSATRYIEDDLWDLANEFPDEEQPITYLTEIPGPRILSFQELMELEAKERGETAVEAPKETVAEAE